MPMPLPGPEEWCVYDLGSDEVVEVVELVAVDRRPFGGPTDAQVDIDGSMAWLRRGSPATVSSELLTVDRRIDVITGLRDARVAVVAPRVMDRSASRADDEADDEEEAWRRQVSRGARTLPRWLLHRTLELEIADLCPDERAAGEPTAAPVVDRERPRLAAAPRRARELLEQALAVSAAGVRWEEMDCEGGQLRLVASARGFGFSFEPAPGSQPPPILWIGSEGPPRAAGWEPDPDGSVFRVFLPHDWLGGPAMAEVGARRSFRVHLHAGGFWG